MVNGLQLSSFVCLTAVSVTQYHHCRRRGLGRNASRGRGIDDHQIMVRGTRLEILVVHGTHPLCHPDSAAMSAPH